MPEALAFIPALFGGLGEGLGGLGAALGLGGAAAGAGEAGAIALPEILVEGAAPAIGLGGPAGAAFGAGDALAGLGAAGAGFGGAEALAGGLSANDIVGNAFDVVNGPQGIAGGTIQPTGAMPNAFAAPSPLQPPTDAFGSLSGGSGLGAASAAPGPGVGAGTASDFATIGPGAATSTPTSLAPTGGGGIGDIVSKIGSGALGQIEKNPLSLALAAPLLKQLISPPKLPQEGQLNALQQQEASFAAQQNQLGQTLTNPLVTGKLPPGAEQSVSNAVQDAITSTKARYANLGLSGSTAEADAIANIQNQKSSIEFQIAQQMAQTGLSATSQAANTFGLQDQVFAQLMQAQLGSDAALSQSLAKFAAAASTTPQGGVNVKLG